MKIDAKVEILIDDPVLNVHCGQTITIPVDCDYVEADEHDVSEWVACELENIYGTTWVDGEDFHIENLNDIIDSISYEDYCEDKAGTYDELGRPYDS